MGDKTTNVAGSLAYRAELNGRHPNDWQREARTAAALEAAHSAITGIAKICRDHPHTIHIVVTVEGGDQVDRLVPMVAPDIFDRREPGS